MPGSVRDTGVHGETGSTIRMHSLVRGIQVTVGSVLSFELEGTPKCKGM